MHSRKFLLAAPLLAVCALHATDTAVAAERALRRTTTDDPATLDPHRMAFPGEQVVIVDLFMGLTTQNAYARPMPGSAESWTVSPDLKTYEFNLRPNLRWSDGVPLTAADFVWSFRRALDPKTAFALASRLFPIRNARSVVSGKLPLDALGVSAPKPNIVRIELEHPAPYLTDLLATALLPAPRHVIEKHGSSWIRPQNFVSNGPFTLDRWLPNAYLRLKRNPYFWGADRVRLDAVYQYPMDNPFTMARRFAAGGIDLVMVVPVERQEWARLEFGSQLKLGRGISNEVLVFNTRKGPTADVRVRRALSMALDRDAIAGRVIGMPGVAAFGYVPPGVLNYELAPGAPPDAVPRMDFLKLTMPQRQAEARRLLTAAGYSPAKLLTIRLAVPATDLNRKVAVAIASDWRKLGMVTPQFSQKETKALVADIAKGDFDSVRLVWLPNYSDPYSFLERLLATGSTVGVNQSGYNNPRFDALLLQAAQTVDLTQRAALLRQAEQMALDDQPVAPIHYLVGRRLVSNRVEGFVDNPRGFYPSWLYNVPIR